MLNAGTNQEKTQILSIFERKEVKYILSAQQHDAFLKEIEGYMAPDMYGLTTICNVYFDTPDFRLVRESIEKPIYKEKLRLRTYGVPGEESNAFIELKKKYLGIVYKRREILPYKDAVAFLVDREKPSDYTQIKREIDWVLDLYDPLKPAMALFYDRIAYAGVEDPELRMTFDNNIRFRIDDVDISHGSHGHPLFDDGRYILEIKITNAMPLWLSGALDKLKIYPGSFSKYGTAYTTLLKDGGII